MNNEVSVLALIIGAGVTIMGIMQYVSKFLQKSEDKRIALFEELEKTKLYNIELQSQLRQSKDELKTMKTHAQTYYRLYKTYEDRLNKSK